MPLAGAGGHVATVHRRAGGGVDVPIVRDDPDLALPPPFAEKFHFCTPVDG